jgi:hypothetical protein
LYYFHQFPTYFWLSNFIVVPAAAVILYGSVVFFLTSFIPGVSGVVVFILKNFIGGMNWCVKTIEQFPGSVIDELFVGLTMVLALYLLIFLLIRFFMVKKVSFLYASLWVIVSLLSFDIYNVVQIQCQEKLIVYNTYPDYLISYLKGSQHYYLATDEISPSQKKLLSEVSGFYSASTPILYTEVDSVSKIGNRNVHSIGEALIIIEESRSKLIKEAAKKSIVIKSNNHRILLYNEASGKPAGFLNEEDAFSFKDDIQFYDLRKGGALIFDFKR